MSGNPDGKQGPRISDLLREALSQKMPANAKRALRDLVAGDATLGQIIGFAVALRAAGGDLEAVGVIADRTEGAPDQHLVLTDLTADSLAAAEKKAADWEQGHAGDAAVGQDGKA